MSRDNKYDNKEKNKGKTRIMQTNKIYQLGKLSFHKISLKSSYFKGFLRGVFLLHWKKINSICIFILEKPLILKGFSEVKN